MGIYCQSCGNEKKPWHAMGTKECIHCANLEFQAEYQFYIGISLLIGIIIIGSMISIFILADYW
jgi:hypothetical protein